MRILTFKKVYLIHGKQRLEWLGYFSPDFSPGMPVSQRCHILDRGGPNPLADMDPPFADLDPRPYQTFLLSIVCIIFGN